MAKGSSKGGKGAGKGQGRSAITGRYVTKATVARNPRTTVTESKSKDGKGKSK